MSIILLAYAFSDGLVRRIFGRLARRFCGGFRRRMLRCHALVRGASRVPGMGNGLGVKVPCRS